MMVGAPFLAFLEIIAIVFVAAAPLWLPVAFFANMLGRRQFSLRLLLFFMAVEQICLAVVGAFIQSPPGNQLWKH